MDITQSQIDGIQSQWQTVEEIAVWATSLLARGNPTQQVIEAENVLEFVASTSIFQAADGTVRLVSRVSLPLANDYIESGRKIWNSVNALSNPAIPSAYLS